MEKLRVLPSSLSVKGLTGFSCCEDSCSDASYNLLMSKINKKEFMKEKRRRKRNKNEPPEDW